MQHVNLYTCAQYSGYNKQVNDEEITLHGASSHIGGFKEGLHCQKCMARASMSSKVQSNRM